MTRLAIFERLAPVLWPCVDRPWPQQCGDKESSSGGEKGKVQDRGQYQWMSHFWILSRLPLHVLYTAGAVSKHNSIVSDSFVLSNRSICRTEPISEPYCDLIVYCLHLAWTYVTYVRINNNTSWASTWCIIGLQKVAFRGQDRLSFASSGSECNHFLLFSVPPFHFMVTEFLACFTFIHVRPSTFWKISKGKNKAYLKKEMTVN